MRHIRRPSRRVTYIVLLVGLIVTVGLVALNQAQAYSGTVYSCGAMPARNCAKEPVAGVEVYLLSGSSDWSSSKPVVLQVTRSDAVGRYWFFGAPQGAVAAVHVGNYRPSTWTGPHAEQPYCSFAAQWMPSHDIEIGGSDLSAIIGDFGGSYPNLIGCPPAIQERIERSSSTQESIP